MIHHDEECIPEVPAHGTEDNQRKLKTNNITSTPEVDARRPNALPDRL